MKKGDRFIVTTGEYSDYGIRDSFVVLKTFSFDLALQRWIEKHGNDGRFEYDSGEQDFLASLRADGHVADEALNEVHLADYSRPETAPAKDAGDEPAKTPEVPQPASGEDQQEVACWVRPSHG